MFIRAKYMFQFSRRDHLQNIHPAIEIVESLGPVFLKLPEARRKEAFHTITDFTFVTRFKS